MKKLRWAMDGDFWEVDLSTPATMDGVARPVRSWSWVSSSRGPQLARPKQIDFFQQFMFMPFVPCFSPPNGGLSLQRLISLPLPDTWFATLLADFNVQKFVTSLTKTKNNNNNVWTHLLDQSLYALNFCSEWLLTPQDTLLLSLEARGFDGKTPPRKKAILHHKFPHHNLTVEAASPSLFLDRNGNYWDVPFTMAVDLASVTSDSGASYHFCIDHNAGSPKQFHAQEDISRVPATLLPHLCAKCAVSFKNNFDIWRSEAPKTKRVQPYDIFLSNPHISASTIVGTVISASLRDNSVKAQSDNESSSFRAKVAKSSLLADFFASVSLSLQHGNFQKSFLDLTCINARLDIPSGSKCISGAARMAFDLYSSRVPSLEEVLAICPSTSVSFQQQIAGPFSFRMDAGVTLDLQKDWYFNVNDPVLAVEYALQVLGSAKAVAWYSLKQREFMAWEGRAYDYCMENLKNMGFPVDGLAFDPELVIRGLVIDKEKGNLVKADRFGYVKRAMHGTTMLCTQKVSEMYGRELVDLRKESRWEFLNTLFSVSEAVAYMQMVDRLDEGAIAADLGPLDYKGLYKAVGKALFRAHVEGQLKSEIMSKPELFVEPDPELPLALLDQKEAGKRLLLITNSDYHYTNKMMQHSFNRFLPNDMSWRDLFDMVIVSARKPEFFQMSHPMYEVVTGEGLMRPCFKAQPGGVYSGGSAQMVENSLGIHGDEILYVGDHIYTDVSQSKVHLRWRTALICRELEEEYGALIHSQAHRATLIELINQKEVVGDLFNQLRLALQRRSKGRPAQTLAATHMDDKELIESIQKLLIVMQRLDHKIGPMLEADGELFNRRWGYLSRAGLWDKSHLMRQIEKYADIYTSRVSNFLHYTPFMYFRAQEQSLAHDSYSTTS